MHAEDKRTEIINRMLAASRKASLKNVGQPEPHEALAAEKQRAVPEPIAITGLAGYFPQSMTVQDFWSVLDNDQSLIDEIPASRINWEGIYDPHGKAPGKSHTKRGGIIPNIRNFDPQFFGILPSEAQLMDPRKRLLLMAVYQALEDAGYAPKSLRKSATGVFVAVEEDEYRQLMQESGLNLKPSDGNSTSLIANQLSYFFDFRGPSEVINTMCSGAAVAIHRAVNALRSGEISCAVVGAANLLLHQDPFIFLSGTGQMSLTDSVHSFGKDAGGYLRADGVASIVLKPLSSAVADGDAVYAVIKNTAVNYNGKGGMSMAAPNIAAHVDLIQSCYEEAGIDPRQVGYIEAQGMGNPVADIAEWEACNRALKAIARKKAVTIETGTCRVSTLKPVAGHMHAASALGALFKIIRSFQTNKVHGILGLTEVHPDLDTEKQPCRLLTATEIWPAEAFPRLAGLHSYGSGGNNAHVLIEEYKGAATANGSAYVHLGKVIVPCSAEAEKQCKMRVENLLEVVAQCPEYDLASVAYTLQVGRDAMKYRVAFVVSTLDELIRQARAYLDGIPVEGVFTGKASAGTASIPSNADDALALAEAWVKGADVTWDRASFKVFVHRVHLPVYPFNCQDYWFSQADSATLPATQNSAGHPLPENGMDHNSDLTVFPNTTGVQEKKKENISVHSQTENPATLSEERPSCELPKAERIVRDVLSTFLLTPPDAIDLDKEFSDFGFDSMLVTNLSARICQQYGLEIESAIFFENTTPKQLIRFLSAEFSDLLAEESPSVASATGATKSEGYRKDDAVTPENKKPVETDGHRKQTDPERLPIAIVGVSGSFPQSPSLDVLWQHLVRGDNCIEEVPQDRWSAEDHFHPDKETANQTGKSYGKWGGFVKDYYHFDPLFFNISPSETALMSPKERLFLQCAWHVLEDAGYTPQSLSGEQVGVFAGVTRGGVDPYKTSTFTISNRVSYVFNFNGPSMTLDTACSSSLVAIHEACQHIYSGECSMALAGGVHVFLDPSHFAVLSSMYMLSPDGSSKAFGEQANGMVPGEGVGLVLLKPLAKAIADQDQIYGVIRGSATNHGGKTNGFTVPNPKAQRDLVWNALRKAEVSAREISYVEAHGTGTPLGDPIEIRGLTEAFKKDTPDTQYCRIGSLKSNIGHLEAAAGISGLVKILLQLKHKKLVPSLHSRTTNPQINFSKTPFIVQQELEDWNPTDQNGNPITRIACVSSFGAGGANAHLVVGEYPQRDPHSEASSTPLADVGNPFVILLSARNEDRLAAQAEQLLTFLRSHQEPFTLADLAYTLQVGRATFEERLAMEVFSREELEQKLEDFLHGRKGIEKLYRGHTQDHKETVALFTQDAEMALVAEGWVSSRNYAKLLSLWVKGLPFDWQKLHPTLSDEQYQPRRISLPGYPFAKEFYGLPEIRAGKYLTVPGGAAVIHPLVQINTSTFFEQKFSATFTGEEFFLKDHVVNGVKFLPGVAYLEMVNIALELAANDGEQSQPEDQPAERLVVQLKHVAWIQPAVVTDDPLKVTIELYLEENGVVRFDICTLHTGAEAENTLHSQGTAGLVATGEAPIIAIAAIRDTLADKTYSPVQCYDLFRRMGITYGPAHTGIVQLYAGKEQVLAKLVLPAVIADTLGQFRLHPALLDAAFQSIIGFILWEEEKYTGELPLPIPFALEELTVFGPCTPVMWAHIRMNGSNRLTGNQRDFDSMSFDIDVTDETGKVCVRMKKYTARVLKKATTRVPPNGTVLFRPAWETEEITVNSNKKDYGQRIVILCGEIGLSAEVLAPQLQGVQVIALQSFRQPLTERMGDYTIQLLGVVQDIFRSRPKEAVLVQLVVPNSGEEKVLASLYGLLKTARTENPHISGQLLSLEEGESPEGVIQKLEENCRQGEEVRVRYWNGQRQQQILQEYVPEDNQARHPWKNGGVYLITGGMGGLGLLFAEEIVRQAPHAALILTGRSALDQINQARLQTLSAAGGTVTYRQVDVAETAAVHALVESISREFGELTGIIHCAGVLSDSLILKKTQEKIVAVLAPKVQGFVNLDQASKALALEIFILCSSSSAVMGNVGQANYAVANAFMDEYAQYRNTLVAYKERRGHTIAINWPLWKDGGMRVDSETEQMMFEKIGMVPLETASGLRALYQAIASGYGQVMVMQGDQQRLRTKFLSSSPKISDSVSSIRIAADETSEEIEAFAGGGLRQKAVEYFKKLLSGVIKLPADQIKADKPMEEYGIDSVMVMQMTNELEKVFGSLSKTLFFEYQNISELTEYFLESHAEKLKALLNSGNEKAHKEQLVTHEKPTADPFNLQPISVKKRKRDRFAGITAWAGEEENKTEAKGLDIAIIGLSGRYPQAQNLREFWDNLRNGRNCVTEIPKDRWEHSQYFDEDKNKTWKTYSKWGGFLDGVDQFDPLFFNISPGEAELLDPQERLFLECAFQTLEDAGYTRQLLGNAAVQGKVGVYVGVMWNEYQLYGAQETALGRAMALSSSPASIANRVSYFCNFSGPSVAIDTMCSSSLTAIHLACQSLRQGECEVAIAGGVNVTIHPNKYLILGYGKIASTKGLCESFGMDGDGYVPSEGVGAVLLKPLSRAIADRDHIYGVIKGSAINHGGKVNGYTVPNPKAQAKVISQALAQADIDPRTVSYLEAHGTGTALGDPIEIAGLTSGFKSQDKLFCAIGSVKSNIGHCESAAGIAGLTKVLLQMKYGQLVPSLHAESLNPNIDFANSPFVVQRELAEWKRPVLEQQGQSQEYPRRAGISSFGAGGANAHVVVEEYIPQELPIRGRDFPASLPVPDSVAIVLSAKTEDRLQALAKQLLIAIQNQSYGDKDLANMAYTLQVGREAAEERLAMEVTSITELAEKLAAFTRDEAGIEKLYAGKVKAHQEMLSFFVADEDMGKTIQSWLKKKKYAKLLGLWVNGFELDWEKLYADPTPGYRPPQRISLPAYPFARHRCWPVIGGSKPESGGNSVSMPVIHPLVHQNTSTFAEQKFSSTFSGEEFFLKDHLVNGEKLLPGAAYLEIVSAAMGLANGQARTGIQIKNMVWAQPLKVNGHPEKIDIRLSPQEYGEVGFEIYSLPGSAGTEPITHSQGVTRFVEQTEHPVLDLHALQKMTNQKVITADACYALFARMGISYGPAQQGIETLYVGTNQVLAKLRLPPVVAHTLDQYYLHPSLLDASLQAVIGFLAHQEDIPLAVPFAIQSLTVLSPCTPAMWAFVRPGSGQAATVKDPDTGHLAFDIDVCDTSGNVCVQIRGFTSRTISKKEKTDRQLDTLLMEPYWEEQEIELPAQTVPNGQHLVIVVERDELIQSISHQLPGAQVVTLNASYPSLAAGFEHYTLQIFGEVKKLLSARPKKAILMQVVVPAEGEKQVFAAIAGLLKTAHLENPLVTGQVIGMERGEEANRVIAQLIENAQVRTDTQIRYKAGKREVLRWRTCEPGKQLAGPIWKDGGIYLITGGAGGLGLILAQEIAKKTNDAAVILTGRSSLTEERAKQLVYIRSMGLRVEYRQADVADFRSVEELIKYVTSTLGKLNGVIHSAGVIRDSFILKKPEAEITEVLAPKVQGVTYLDVATREIPLDFFIVCSSSAGVTGNAGQADYATANAYLDRYAAYRDWLVLTGQRSGKTLSVNWPLWKDGGMHLTAENEKRLFEQIGMVPLETMSGIQALYEAMTRDAAQMMVAQGEGAKLRATFLAGAPEERTDASLTPVPSQANHPVDPLEVPEVTYRQAEVLAYFKQIVSGVTKLPVDHINADKSLEEYGIDSIMVMRMTNELEKVFGSLSKTLFFEYGNIRELTEYFEQAFPEKLSALVKTDEETTIEAGKKQFKPPVFVTMKNPVTAGASRRFTDTVVHRLQKKTTESDALDIAIIGISGSYPQANDISAFWQVLKEGKNCITEVPKGRWNHDKYFAKEKNKAGKTYGKWGGFLDGVDEFDPLFFNISPKEAEIIDPQERLFLQCVHATLEDAGYTKNTVGYNVDAGIKGQVGVYVGVMNEEYQLYGSQETALGRPLVLGGNSASIANRVSYFYNFNGPSITLNTMCSSSLTTIHLACQSLRLGECEAAIAGGVNVTVHPNKYLALSYGNFLSSRGLCESFGAGGDGYVPGEGVGAVLLKPLAQAIVDRDHIYGVIKGTAINHGGKTNGYTVPSPKAQAHVIEKAMKRAGFDPRTVTYLEAHGTGTLLGDPIEITGLNRAFATEQNQFCAIGSVKSNIGHCESAAGIAGLTKVLLQMKYGQLVPSLHAESLNPNIDFANSPFVVQRELAEWKRPVLALNGEIVEVPRRAGISSFGAGGANAHVLLEEFIPESTSWTGGLLLPVQTLSPKPALIVLSAKSSIQLKQQAEKLLGWIREAAPLSAPQLADMAYTLQTGREAMEERLAVEVSSLPQLEEKLRKFTHGEQTIANLYRGTNSEQDGVVGVMGTDDYLAAMLDDWVDKQKYGKLLDLWVRGVPFDWNKLYPNENRNEYHPRRLSLPTYPFLRKRCWFRQLAETPGVEPDAKEASAQTAALPPQAMMLTKQWEESPFVSRSVFDQHVAILYSPETQEIAAGLTQKLTNSVLINVHDADVFQPERLRSVEWGIFAGFVDLVGCGRNPVESLDWIQWLQHLIEHGRKEEIRLLGVTAQLTGFQNDAVNLTGASRTGLYRMLQSEYSHVVSRHVDVEDTVVTVLVQQILDELFSRDEEPMICYRDGKRYRPVLQEVAAKLSRERVLLPGNPVVWITGGTRGLGYLCARHLVQNYGVKRLVLTGQEELPARITWESYLPQDTGLAQKIKNVLALETQGAEVQVLAVPLTDKDSLAKNVAQIKDTWGPITGVIHCAGVGDRENPAFIKKSIAGIQTVLDPKVKGLANLYECLGEEPLAFFVLFSSVSALVPSLGVGQAAYAMANAYMDHFAEAKWDRSRIISIEWPNWKETGMGEVKTKAYQQTGLRSITDDEGLQALDLILREKIGPVVLPAWVNKDVWEPEKLLLYTRPAKSDTNRSNTVDEVRTGSRETGSELLGNKVQQWLTDLFTQELKLDMVDLKPDKPFQDYGIDSILITQLLHPIQKTIQRDIDPSILYEHATIKSFANWLLETFPEHLARIFSPAKEMHPAVVAEKQSEAREQHLTQTSPVTEESPSRSTNGTDIAVVGMTCRFPGAPDLDAYWKLLTEGRSAIQTVPPERWNSVTSYAAGLLEDPYFFDPKFFFLAENDARAMDPQALIVLEETLKLFYQSGYTLEEIKGKPIGVYLGGRSKHAPGMDQLKSTRNPIVAVGQNYLSANVSQFFDLRGPGLVVDTACSSALVGMNMAIPALLNGEIESAVVGGVSLLSSVETHELFQQRGLLNPGNHFHIFDRRAGGIVLGEGVGMVLLKTVDQAMKDGDRIYATIQSVAVNNDGRTAGPATPNIEAQKEVMRKALAKAGKKPEEIGYIEVNGSGSEVTDLIEIKAINAVYRSSISAPCGLGSVKPNIGHPLCAEGIASFIKVVLMLHHRQIVPFLSGQQPMKYFDIAASPFHFTDTLRAWPEALKVAAVNCFADGGTNAHVIIEAWTGDSGEKVRREPLIIPALHRRNLRSDETQLTSREGNDYSSIVSDNAVMQSVWETFE